MKLLADVGLVGYPNAGKSTLISRISAAKPKIADYPFTTLQPNLGVVTIGDPPHEDSYVVADIPGLIEGAHEGTGLGIQFLRHIERTRVLAHLIDVSDASGRPDVVHDFKVIMNELASFGADLEKKPMIVVASKLDVANQDKLAALRKHCKKLKLDLYEDFSRHRQGHSRVEIRAGQARGGDSHRDVRSEKACTKESAFSPQSQEERSYFQTHSKTRSIQEKEK